MKILVFGGRSYREWQVVYKALDAKLIEHGDNLIVIHGDCKTGADRFAGQWARQNVAWPKSTSRMRLCNFPETRARRICVRYATRWAFR
jgi:hypothetical protein